MRLMNLKRKQKARRRKFIRTSAEMSLKLGPKIWQLHRSTSGNKAQTQISDFRREDDIWVRTLEDKGTAFLG